MKSRADAEKYIAAETSPRSGKLSQRARILRLLLSAPEVGLPEILDLRISQYYARINELRGLGFDIPNRTAHISGVVHSWYSLNFDAPAVQAPLSQDWYTRSTGKARPAVAPEILFLWERRQ
jgi:hypothetical protein